MKFIKIKDLMGLLAHENREVAREALALLHGACHDDPKSKDFLIKPLALRHGYSYDGGLYPKPFIVKHDRGIDSYSGVGQQHFDGYSAELQALLKEEGEFRPGSGIYVHLVKGLDQIRQFLEHFVDDKALLEALRHFMFHITHFGEKCEDAEALYLDVRKALVAS